MLSAVDIFRRVPRDLTEASKLGGLVSLVAITVLGALLVLEVKSLRSVNLSTRIDVAHQEDMEFRVNLNFTFPSMSCDLIHLDFLDVVGHRRGNLTESATLHKYTLHGTYVASAVKAYSQERPPPHPTEAHPGTGRKVGIQEQEEGGAASAQSAEQQQKQQQQNDPHWVVVHNDGRRRVIDLSPDNFHQTVNDHRLVLVNFYAPWCPYCVALAPVYERAAVLAEEGVKGAPGQIAFASVNCMDRNNFDLCRRSHIMVFPSVRVFRDGRDNPTKQPLIHEEYRGARSAEDISKFALSALDEVKQNEDPVEQARRNALRSGPLLREYSEYGCIVVGFANVPRVPGALVFTAHSEKHEVNAAAVNFSHVVTHLSFGTHPHQPLPLKTKPEPGGMWRNSKATTDAGGQYTHTVPEEDSGKYSTLFISYEEQLTHEHYLKIIPTRFEPLDSEPRSGYEYSINSNVFRPMLTLPTVRIVWDVLPMEVVVSETRTPLIQGVFQLIGFLGGVYAFFMILAGATTGLWRHLRKASEGKLT
eukprot:TRINITY_DN3857_c0_g1_i2.p1 TRINITY_DN3857_c0_g1~~TRINITY_DN3857_c0_g1_i2.p1  ORF type:complete len:531 (+),score=118.09 TRINITY_DN3857_c0_g1_i2:79-1671(+)